jgi:hypothetical protein
LRNLSAVWTSLGFVTYCAAASVERTAPVVSPSPSRVVITHHSQATAAFKADLQIVSNMVAKAMAQLTGKSNVAAVWQSLATTQDVIGLKVYSSPGANSGTRSAVAAAVVEQLIAAGFSPQRIVVWDKHRADLRRAGFLEFTDRYGVRVEGSMDAGYDEKVFYETPAVGNLVWGDLEFGKIGEGIGRKSYVSKVVSKEITKIINITPLLNHNAAGVCGNLFSLAVGSVDNTLRFETDPTRLAEAVPEIYALEAIGDRVVLNITDALICQYEGEQRTLLHYSTVLNELRFSRDPVALDVLSLRELERERKAASAVTLPVNRALYVNAEVLDLGVADTDKIRIERLGD